MEVPNLMTLESLLNEYVYDPYARLVIQDHIREIREQRAQSDRMLGVAMNQLAEVQPIRHKVIGLSISCAVLFLFLFVVRR